MPTLTKPIAAGRTAEVYAWDDQTVLKLYRSEFPSNWADREASIGRQVCASGIRAPAVLDLVEVDGRRGILYERIQGISILEELSRRPWKLFALARQLAELQTELHLLHVPELTPLRDQLQGSIKNAKDLPPELRDPILQLLDGLPDGDCLCHGDFHPGNVILTAQGPVIIDWMTASAGNPWADVARTCLLLTISAVPQDTPARRLILLARQFFYRAYLNHYLDHAQAGRKQLTAWMPVLAAARLNENILPEREVLLDQVRTGLAGIQPGV